MAQDLTDGTALRDPELEPPPPGRSSGKAIWWVLGSFVVITLLLIGLHNLQAKKNPGGPGGGQRGGAAAGSGGGAGGGGRRGGGAFNGVVPVAVAAAGQQDVPVYLVGLGNVQAYYTVTVHSRVDGQLMRVNFKEGQRVHKGEELALIDPRPYEATLSQVEATKFKDQANLQNSQRDLQRYADLFKQGVIAEQQYNTQQALVAQNEGAVRADDALINSAKLNVTYCHVIAPIDGVVGLRLVDPGNMVHASDQSGLIVITQLQPISLLFTLPEDNLQTVAKQMKAGPMKVEAWSRDNTKLITTGRLETIDNQIDQSTGTFRLKGVFDNKDNSLFPNQFVNARLLVTTMKNAVVVPVAAVQNGAQGNYVYVVDENKKAQVRNVTPGLTQGTMMVISSGLQPGEQVVTDGQERLQPGNTVEIQQRGGGQGGQTAAGGQGDQSGQGGQNGRGQGRRRNGNQNNQNQNNQNAPANGGQGRGPVS